MTAEPAARARLSAEERRRQLIGIGLRLLVTRPIHELSIDEVAADAGISRGLLFHYFPTKRDYYAAVVRAAAQRMLRHAQAPKDASPAERIRGITEGFTGFVQRRRENYVALVRAAAGGDPMVVEVFEETRQVITDRVLEAVGEPDPAPLVRLAVRGWLAMAEEMAIESCGPGSAAGAVALPDLVDFLVAALDRVLRQAGGR